MWSCAIFCDDEHIVANLLLVMWINNLNPLCLFQVRLAGFKQCKARHKTSTSTCSRPVPWSFFTIMKCFCTTCEALYTTARVAPQAVGFCRSGRIDLLLAQKYELLRLDSKLDSDHRVAFNLFRSWVVKQLTTDSGIDKKTEAHQFLSHVL